MKEKKEKKEGQIAYIQINPDEKELKFTRSVQNLSDLAAYAGGIFSGIFAFVSFIASGINKFYSNSSIIDNLYNVKVQK